MNVGDKVIFKPIDYSTHKQDTSHKWYGEVATIIKKETLDRFWIAFDNFPKVNYREYHNRFCVNAEELVKVGETE